MAITLGLSLLVLRLGAGLTIAAHGAQKLFGWFGGPGFTKLAQGFEKQGFKPAWLWASLVILGELVYLPEICYYSGNTFIGGFANIMSAITKVWSN